jgi:hypothetical protein
MIFSLKVMEALFNVYIRLISQISKGKSRKHPSYSQIIQVLELQGTISVTVKALIAQYL